MTAPIEPGAHQVRHLCTGLPCGRVHFVPTGMRAIRHSPVENPDRCGHCMKVLDPLPEVVIGAGVWR